MKLGLTGHDRRYEIQGVCQLFFPGVSFSDEDGDLLISVYDSVTRTATASFTRNGRTFSTAVTGTGDDEREPIKRSVYDVLCEATGLSSPWGILTGIRPAVYYQKLKNATGERADAYFSDVLGVRDDKLSLAKKVCETRRPAVESLSDGTVSLYVSVPFCPSKCRYCSFVSATTEKEGQYIEPYLDALETECKRKGELLRRAGVTVDTVYVGGGTPGVLTAPQTERLLSALERSFDLSQMREFTYEAGRPDVATAEKFDVLKAHGVGRVSVNTQTLNDEVLRGVGRRHTAAQFFEAYELAARRGFTVNVDMIAGLPGETPESFFDTVTRLCALHPADLTLHSLYLKRAAKLTFDENEVARMSRETGKMVTDAETLCESAGYLPYYLYRQKSTVGNHENVGYALPGAECLYNIYMMDDLQTVIGLGANAMSKFVTDPTHPVRIANTKFAYNYIGDLARDLAEFEKVAGQVWTWN